jgi:hypothetical protein
MYGVAQDSLRWKRGALLACNLRKQTVHVEMRYRVARGDQMEGAPKLLGASQDCLSRQLWVTLLFQIWPAYGVLLTNFGSGRTISDKEKS